MLPAPPPCPRSPSTPGGPFAGDGAKLKNEYVWHLTAADIAAADLDLSSRSAK